MNNAYKRGTIRDVHVTSALGKLLTAIEKEEDATLSHREVQSLYVYVVASMTELAQTKRRVSYLVAEARGRNELLTGTLLAALRGSALLDILIAGEKEGTPIHESLNRAAGDLMDVTIDVLRLVGEGS